MDNYICIFCGYVFDEAKGVSGERIAPNGNAMIASPHGCGWHKPGNEIGQIAVEPGTKWEDIPNNFVCPSCESGKDMFEDYNR